MRKSLYEIGRTTIMNLIEKIKNNIRNSESEYKNRISEDYNNILTYEDYILRSRISVFKYREDL